MKWAVLILLVVLSACVSPTRVSNGILLDIQANPKEVFAANNVDFILDVRNENGRPIEDVALRVFDTGLLKTVSCDPPVSIEKDALQTFVCVLQAPDKSRLPNDRTDNEVSAAITYKNSLVFTQPVKFMSQAEYELETKTGNLRKDPVSYIYSDKNMEVHVDFSNAPPFIDDPSPAGVRKNEYVYFTIKNIGNGLMTKVNFGNSNIVQERNLVDCGEQTVYIQGSTFPRIACKVSLPGDTTYLSNTVAIINIDYDYEVRGRLNIPIIK